jgi:hypothetical protein
MKSAVEVISRNIKQTRTLHSNKIYVIEGEVRVEKGVRLTVQDNTTILLVNGEFPKSCVRRSTLIFDQGSILVADRLYVRACTQTYKPVKLANNGGVWFLGNYSHASKDGVSVKTNRRNPLSSFTAKLIATYYLGRPDDPTPSKRTKRAQRTDDVDGFSVLGVGKAEWNISEVRSFHSADDAFDVTNSHISLKRLQITLPVEDGMNISSSRVEIHHSLRMHLRKTKAKDRDLFDLETDDGASFVELYSGCWVTLEGVFGDQAVLSSTQMPKAITRDDNERLYSFKGKLRSAALIYSIDRD